jgi:uncharacterized protein (DUF1778 family)
MAGKRASAEKLDHRARGARLGFRLDRSTKSMVERAAYLERRSVTDFCLTALGVAAQQSIARHETLVLSERERAVYFEALIHPRKPPSRLKRAVKAERERIER